MSKITGIIAPQSFARIRDQIGSILTDELENQLLISNDYELETVEVWSERFIPFDKEELPAVNVSLARGDLDGQTAIQMDGTYRYNIDVYHSAKTKGQEKTDHADVLAMIRLQKLMGLCYAILMDAQYNRLGFAPPFIMNRHVESLAIAQPDAQDGRSSVMGRLVLVVKAPELSELIQPAVAAGYDTQVKLDLTDKGYKWISDN